VAGFWQLGRADEKRALFAAFDHGAEAKTRLYPVTNTEAEQYLYQHFTLTGRYEPERQILLDNMIHDGQPGYQVLTPLILDTTAVLVNRGWLPANPDRAVIPDTAVTSKTRAVSGRLYRLPRSGYTLEPVALQPNSVWPRRLLFPSVKEIVLHIGFPVHDYQLLLDPTDDEGYTRDWRPALMSPEKHLAYAIQWFMMAATILIIYIALNIRATRSEIPDV
jgi:surfeit locus 1 family protein